jgi:hypothetical protein
MRAASGGFHGGSKLGSALGGAGAARIGAEASSKRMLAAENTRGWWLMIGLMAAGDARPFDSRA